MKRMAILIASPTVNLDGYDHNTVLSANNTIDYWKYHLQAPRLGSWIDEKEIQYRSDWNKQNLKKFIQSLIGIDYIFFVYCGHGARFPKQGCVNPVSENDYEDYILLNYGREKVRLEEIREEIASVTDNATMLIDACREKVWQMSDGATPITVPQILLNEQTDNSREEWMRQFGEYDPLGVVLIQSCSPGKLSYVYPPTAPEFALFSSTIFGIVNSADFSMSVGDVFKNAYDKTVFWANSSGLGEQKPTCSIDPEALYYPLVLTDGYKTAAKFMPQE
jgi:hypothetical protein